MKLKTVVAALATTGVFPAEAEAQRFTQVPTDPGQPIAEGFETDRALFWAAPNFIPSGTLNGPRSARRAVRGMSRMIPRCWCSRRGARCSRSSRARCPTTTSRRARWRANPGWSRSEWSATQGSG